MSAGGKAPSGGAGGSAGSGAGTSQSGGGGGATQAGGGGASSGATGGSDDPHGGSDASGGGGAAGSAGDLGGYVAAGGMALGGAGQGGSAGSVVVVGGRAGGGSGGMAGQGSAGGPPVVTTCASMLAIDDLEDGDDRVCANQGRSGEWWAATGTPTGTTDPSESGEFEAYLLGADAPTGSKYGMRLSGTGFGATDDDWASLGFYLAGGSAYDASGHDGIAFYAKSEAGPLELHVTFATSSTTPESDGGTCVDDCNDHYSAPVVLDSSWKEFKVPFSSLVQEGWGEKPEDLPHTLFVYFGFLGTDAGASSFGFLVDDVRFY